MPLRLSIRPGLIILAVLFFCFDSGHAFDGKRKGFNLGVGLTATPYSKWRIEAIDEYDEFQAWGLNGLIGYAFNEQNLLAFQGSWVVQLGDPDVDNDDLFQGYDGIFWIHYYGSVGRSLFSSAGVVRPYSNLYCGGTRSGYGVAVGGGYEFTKQVQTALTLALAKNTEDEGDINHVMIHLAITVVGY